MKIKLGILFCTELNVYRLTNHTGGMRQKTVTQKEIDECESRSIRECAEAAKRHPLVERIMEVEA